jgi:hypothetical protein
VQDWTPTDVERQLIAADDLAVALGLLRAVQLVLPLPPGDGPPAWTTAPGPERTWLLAYTSVEAMVAATNGALARGRISSLPELAAGWPDLRWGLWVNPGLPGDLAMESGTVARLAAPTMAEDLQAHPEVRHPVVEKLLTHDELGALLADGVGRVSGYVHPVVDVEHIASPAVLVAALGRSADAADLVSRQGSVHLLRWPAVGPELYRSPYGGTDEETRDAVSGWLVEEPPFVGTGFAPQVDQLVREYLVHGVVLPHGAEVWELDAEGLFSRHMVFDGDRETWVLLVATPAEGAP